MIPKVKTDPVKTVLTITVGFLVIFLVNHQSWAIITALGIGIAGVFSPFLSRKIDFLWMKLAWVLSLIMPNIILTIVFFLILFPIAALSRLFGKKDPLQLKNSKDSTFSICHKEFKKESFEKPW